ncbi:hypothetical protein [Umezakia ovalisporum]
MATLQRLGVKVFLLKILYLLTKIKAIVHNFDYKIVVSHNVITDKG